jgi:polysaccharide export outer membrane protein
MSASGFLLVVINAPRCLIRLIVNLCQIVGSAAWQFYFHGGTLQRCRRFVSIRRNDPRPVGALKRAAQGGRTLADGSRRESFRTRKVMFMTWLVLSKRVTRLLLLAVVALASGCHAVQHHVPKHGPDPLSTYSNLPRELSKVSLPPYTIEPPDILVIEAIRVVPRPPYQINTLDVLLVQVAGTLPDYPIQGAYTVEPGGTINLGVPYGSVKVVGLTLEQAQQQIHDHLTRELREPLVSVTLAELSGKQNIAGQHLVSQDGTVTLGSYGSVYVVGMTLEQAKYAIEAHLSRFLENPEIAVDVFAYNSKVYYVVTQGAGLGDGITSFPITGNETVLDAIARINGLTQVSSKHIWIARPVPGDHESQILEVDWHAITAGGRAETNYQILPGDRVFVQEDKLVALDTALGKIIAPMERVMGFTILGTSTISGIKFFNRRFGNFSNSGPIIVAP